MQLTTPALLERAPAKPVRERPTHAHVPALDGVRGTAVLLVVINHVAESLQGEFEYYDPVTTLARLGWVGVDLFFVLSGFLITGILYDAKHGAGYFKNFYARRALRIFPLYYLALTVVLAMRFVVPNAHEWGTQHPAWAWVYATNFIMATRGAWSFGVLDHFWSLAVEEHFYFVWPTCVYFLSRRGLMITAFAMLVVAFGLRVWYAGYLGDGFAAYVLTPTRMDALAAGGLVALAARRPVGLSPLTAPARVAAVLLALAFGALVVWRHDVDQTDPFIASLGLSTLSLFFAAVLVLVITWAPVRRVAEHGLLRWFGKYSYGLYVWHPIVFVLLFHTETARALRDGQTPVHALLNSALALSLSLALTLLSYHLVEEKFLRLKHRFQ
jgi:peptidoglycan/LPS O-acetylase OafA/YrhL